MPKPASTTPYEDNVLTRGLGPIQTQSEALRALMYLPPPPTNVADIPLHHRLYHLIDLQDLHIPNKQGPEILRSTDILLRKSYRYRDPTRASTWRSLSGENVCQRPPRAPPMGCLVTGHSGTGKTQAILHALASYPEQVIRHERFPQISSEHRQVVWLSVDVPASGRSADLAANLMIAWDAALERSGLEGPGRFAKTLERERRDGPRMFEEWRQVAMSHFLGILHLDEIQNFFKLSTLRQRRSRRSRGLAELSVVEDKCLRLVLELFNTWGLPVILSGTPDGVAALTKRFSTTQRMVGGGYHEMSLLDDPHRPEFRDLFFPQLLRYQYLQRALADSDSLRETIIELTAGIPRLIIALWFAAQRVALDQGRDELRIEDLPLAARTYLAPTLPAVAALKSKDPKRMENYEDLQVSDDFWATFWSRHREN